MPSKLLTNSEQELQEGHESRGVSLNVNPAGTQKGCNVLSPSQQIGFVSLVKVARDYGLDGPCGVPYIEAVRKLLKLHKTLNGANDVSASGLSALASIKTSFQHACRALRHQGRCPRGAFNSTWGDASVLA